MFVIEQALSVRALQELMASGSEEGGGLGSGHKTLLYGNAILLRHANSNMVSGQLIVPSICIRERDQCQVSKNRYSASM